MLLSRRLFLRRAGAATVAVAGTAVAAHAAPVRTPDERIAAAIDEIKAAMVEKHVGWRVQVQNTEVRPVNGQTGEQLAPCRHAVLIYASKERYGPEEAGWFVNYVDDRQTA